MTLLFSSRDTEHNNVVALRTYLGSKRRSKLQREFQPMPEDPELSGRPAPAPPANTTSPPPANPVRAVTDEPRGFASPPCYLAEFDGPDFP